MEERHRESAVAMRARIEHERHDAPTFRAALLDVPPRDRDAWLDLVLGIREVPDDGAELPRGCVPYLPCPIDALLRTVDEARIGPSDLFVDVGAGIGRAAIFVHLVSGAAVRGIEVQTRLVREARAVADALLLSRVAFTVGDAAERVEQLAEGTVYFLYCPFGGERLAAVLARLERVARQRAIRVCSVDLPLPSCTWLVPLSREGGDLAVYHAPLLDTPAPP